MGRKKIGRNEKCPCGSGLKYKKCCLRKGKDNPYARGSAVPALDAKHKVAPAERAYAWGVGFSPAAADAVATGEWKPKIALHPWVVARLRNLTGLGPGRRAPRHTIASVRKMETEAILAALTDLGVEVDLSKLEAEAEIYTSAWELALTWGEVALPDQELLGLAGCELWRRTLPTRPSLEMLDGQMQAGYSALRHGRPHEAVELWLDLWDQLLLAFPGASSMDDLSELFPTGLNSVWNWAGDFEERLASLAQDDLDLALRIRDLYARLVERMSDRGLRGYLAEYHYLLGECAEGEALLVTLMEEDPYDPRPYTVLSDHLGYAWDKEAYQDLPRAISLLEQALALPVREASSWDIEARLRDHRMALAVRVRS